MALSQITLKNGGHVTRGTHIFYAKAAALMARGHKDLLERIVCSSAREIDVSDQGQGPEVDMLGIWGFPGTRPGTYSILPEARVFISAAVSSKDGVTIIENPMNPGTVEWQEVEAGFRLGGLLRAL